MIYNDPFLRDLTFLACLLSNATLLLGLTTSQEREKRRLSTEVVNCSSHHKIDTTYIPSRSRADRKWIFSTQQSTK